MDNDGKRIAEALGIDEVPVVDKKNLLKYRKYLLARLDKNTVLTGREDFLWEEKYVLGGVAEFSGPHVIDVIASNEPYSEDDNLGLIATDNVYLGIQSTNQAAAKAVQCRLVCSRIKMTADAYAALVTNELSS